MVTTEGGGEAQADKQGQPVAEVRGGPSAGEPRETGMQTEQRRGENSHLGFGQSEPGWSKAG